MPDPCCAEVGPLLVAPGTSGRSWTCETCGRLWSPEPTTDDPGDRADDVDGRAE